MKNNLRKIVYLDLSIIRNSLIQQGFKQDDEWYIEKEIDDVKIGISLYPELLSFDYNYRPGHSEKSIVEETYNIWIACQVNYWDGGGFDNHYEMAKFVKDKIFPLFPSKPFHDEDAFSGYFRKTRHDDVIELTFFVNPDYPEGWWQNHIL